MKILIHIALILISLQAIAQVPELELQEVKVFDSLKISSQKVLSIKRAAILEYQVEDVGQLLQKMAGVNIRSYGGLGGLKTISVRSLGSQHTSIVVDGFTLNNTQTGQVNLGSVQVDNIEAMYLVTGSQKSVLVPSSAQISGSALYIETFENSFSTEKHRLRFSSKVGSFGQFDNYLAYKLNYKKIYLSVFGKFRYADGSYKYSFQNGPTLYNGIRENNRYQDFYSGISFGWRVSENGAINVNFKTDASEQDLPGAVILYSQNSFQTLKTNNDRFQLSYIHHFKKLIVRLFSSGTIGKLIYHDPSYLNQQGEIYSKYINENFQAGINGRYILSKQMTLFGGIEQQISRLKSNSAINGIPIRNHNFSVLGLKYSNKFINLTSQISTQYVDNSNTTLERKKVFRANPFIQLETKELNKKSGLILNVFYRNSMRMPSFNELYYNNIGNSNLKPEDANQLSGGFLFAPKYDKFSFMNRSNVYFNQVNNKILAIPTKNLFIWSMQNIGKVNIFGAETTFDLIYKINSKWNLSSNLNYTLQLATDITDKDSPTFGHQIAYIPKHTFNADFSVKRNSIGFRWSTFGNSIRYSLNENIVSNEVEAFIISDLSVFGSVKIGKQDFRLQFTCKNIFNSSYAIVRYYVMPGRNYLISLNYAIN